jgi:hypothetical protein
VAARREADGRGQAAKATANHHDALNHAATPSRIPLRALVSGHDCLWRVIPRSSIAAEPGIRP